MYFRPFGCNPFCCALWKRWHPLDACVSGLCALIGIAALFGWSSMVNDVDKHNAAEMQDVSMCFVQETIAQTDCSAGAGVHSVYLAVAIAKCGNVTLSNSAERLCGSPPKEFELEQWHDCYIHDCEDLQFVLNLDLDIREADHVWLHLALVCLCVSGFVSIYHFFACCCYRCSARTHRTRTPSIFAPCLCAHRTLCLRPSRKNLTPPADDVVRFSVFTGSRCCCSAESAYIDDYEHWLKKDQLSYCRLPQKLRDIDGFKLSDWQSLICDMTDIVNRERSDASLVWYCMFLLPVGACYIVNMALFTKSSIKYAVLEKCSEYTADWQPRFGISVLPASHDEQINFPEMGQKMMPAAVVFTEGGDGMIGVQLHITSLKTVIV